MLADVRDVVGGVVAADGYAIEGAIVFWEVHPALGLPGDLDQLSEENRGD